MKIANAEIAATPASSPSSPSMKFIALVSTTVSSTVSTMPWVWSRTDQAAAGRPAAGQPEHLPLHAEQHQHAGGEDLAGQLGDRVQVEPVVQHADQADQAAGGQHPDDLRGRDERAAQRRQLQRHQHGGGEPGVDGDAAHPRDRQRVHVPVADRRDRADPDGEHPHHAGEQEGDDDGGAEDQRVLARGIA